MMWDASYNQAYDGQGYCNLCHDCGESLRIGMCEISTEVAEGYAADENESENRCKKVFITVHIGCGQDFGQRRLPPFLCDNSPAARARPRSRA